MKGDPNLQNSFLIVADGAPGDVAAKLVARSDSQLREVELLGKDLKDPQNGGNHPWSIESGTDSTLLLFNTSSVPQYFNVAIAAGSTVWRKAYQLQPMQTKAISILDLVTHQIKDDKGNVIAMGITSGQVQWHSPSANAGRGRLLQSSSERAMARNFSCGMVIDLCQVNFSGTTYQADGSTIDFGAMNPYVCANSCSGTPVGPGGSGYGYIWSSDNPGIASISGSNSNANVQTYGASAGSTYLYGQAYDASCAVYISPPPANVCDFTITPPSVTASSCSVAATTKNFQATVTPSASACPRTASRTTCSATSLDGAIDGVTYVCTDNPNYSPNFANAAVTFFAGPGTSGQKVGDLGVGFSLVFGGNTVSHSSSIQVNCP